MKGITGSWQHQGIFKLSTTAQDETLRSSQVGTVPVPVLKIFTRTSTEKGTVPGFRSSQVHISWGYRTVRDCTSMVMGGGGGVCRWVWATLQYEHTGSRNNLVWWGHVCGAHGMHGGAGAIIIISWMTCLCGVCAGFFGIIHLVCPASSAAEERRQRGE